MTVTVITACVLFVPCKDFKDLSSVLAKQANKGQTL